MPTRTDQAGRSALQASLDVRVVFSRLRRRLLAVTDADDLSPSQASVLRRLGKGEVSTASALALAEEVKPQSIGVTLAGLEQLKLISRTPDPTDGRRQIVEITATGRERVEGARQALEEWLATSLQEQFSEDERQTIIAAMALLERLVG